MNDQDFKNLVTRMRQAQKDFFRIRKSGSSIEVSSVSMRSKDLERQVDAICFPKPVVLDQPKLF